MYKRQLYGQNASGKSNFIKALDAMQRIVKTSNQNLAVLPIIPFKFSDITLNKPSVFEVTILVSGVRYQYGFSATQTTIHEEWLFAYPKGRAQTWFERTFNLEKNEHKYTFGSKLLGDKEVWKRATRPNALFLSTAIQLNSQQLQPVFNWFIDTLHIVGIHGFSPHFSIEWCQDDRKQEILDFLKTADFAIADIQVNEKDISSEHLPKEVLEHIKKNLGDNNQNKANIPLKQIQLSTTHQSNSGNLIDLDLDEESSGTQKMFSFAGPWLDSLSQGNVLFIDELHDNLHPLLVKFLVQLFHNNEKNNKGAQLIFSTHETSILNQDILRHDQVWFCERGSSQDTRLFPLTDFSPRKDIANLERAYLSGRYGALPFLHQVSENFGR